MFMTQFRRVSTGEALRRHGRGRESGRERKRQRQDGGVESRRRTGTRPSGYHRAAITSGDEAIRSASTSSTNGRAGTLPSTHDSSRRGGVSGWQWNSNRQSTWTSSL